MVKKQSYLRDDGRHPSAVMGMHRYSLWSSRKGTTLVEILVAMVVLLVGILTIVQLFPTGFRVVRAAESQTIATRLAQQELERWKNMDANLPAGILPVDENGNVLNLQPPGPPFEAFRTNPDGSWMVAGNRYERGNAYNCRQVVSEATLIPMGNYFSSGQGPVFGSRYTAAFSPIDAWRDDNDVLQGVTIKSGDLNRRVAESGFDPPYLRQGSYAIDYDLSPGQDYSGQDVFHVAFPADPGVSKRKYLISYSYWATASPDDPNAEPELFSRLDQPVHRSNGGETIDGSDADWIEVPILGVPDGYTVTELEIRTETCARGFIEQTGDFTGDPYEFKLVDSIIGVFAFNPAGHKMYEYTARGIRPIEARISYLINDPRIIREDRVIPEAQPGASDIPTKLALRFVLKIGDATDNPDEPEYQGLVRDHSGKVAVALPVLVMDLATGWRVNLPPDCVDFISGVVYLPLEADLVDYTGSPQARTTLAGRHLRFLYRADGDWTVQCHKAYLSYTRRWSAGDLDYRTYRIKPNESSPSRLSNRLLFAPCEGLKTVVVDYSYIALDGVERKVSGEAHQINFDSQTEEWCVDLKVPPGAYIPRDSRMVVVGASFTARVLWRDGKTWRHVTMDTHLTKS